MPLARSYATVHCRLIHAATCYGLYQIAKGMREQKTQGAFHLKSATASSSLPPMQAAMIHFPLALGTSSFPLLNALLTHWCETQKCGFSGLLDKDRASPTLSGFTVIPKNSKVQGIFASAEVPDLRQH